MAKRLLVLQNEELFRALKAECARSGVTMAAAVEQSVRWYLGQPTSRSAVERSPAPMKGSRTHAVRAPKTNAPPAPEPVVAPNAPEPPVVEDACKRCGHPRDKHWVKGCLAGCPCSEQRYRE